MGPTEVLRHESERGAGGNLARADRLAADGEGAGRRRAQPGDERHERGLARAVRAEEAKELAGRDLERDIIEGDEAAVALGNGTEGEHRVRGTLSVQRSTLNAQVRRNGRRYLSVSGTLVVPPSAYGWD